MRYLITGATGFVGQALVDELLRADHHVSVLCHKRTQIPLSCTRYLNWDQIPDNAFFDVVVNLAGSPIDRRWTRRVKDDLIKSRVETTRALLDKIRTLHHKPEVMISASAVGFYGDHQRGEIDEKTPPMPSFTNELCQAWEEEAKKAEKLGLRVCIVRLGVVLGAGGGALKKIVPPFKFGLGAVLGRGDQPFSWIHLRDVLKAVNYLIDCHQCSGIYNLVAPFLLTYKDFAKAVGKSVKRPVLLKVPSVLLKILLGEMASSLLLQGSCVVPKRLLEEGFEFNFPELDAALNDIFVKHMS